MKPAEVRATIAQLAASQWGLITTAQATAAGATRMLLTRMTDNGELERVVYGVYAVPAALADEQLEKRALWLTLDPTRTAEQRLARRHEAGVLSHATAAALHGIGDILDHRVEVTVPRRQQSRREDLRLHRAELRPDEVTYAEGLPVTTASRTIADLVVADHDRDHVATALRDAVHQDLTTPEQVSKALEEHLGTEHGSRVLAELLAAASLDEASLENAVLNSPISRRAIGTALQTFLRAYNELAPQLDIQAVASALATLPKMLPTPDPAGMARSLAAISEVLKTYERSDEMKQILANVQLRNTLLRFNDSYAHIAAPALDPAVQQAIRAAHDSTNHAGTSTNKPASDNEEQAP
jgi:hypothetical protein